MSIQIDLDDVSRRIDRDEDVSPIELREWINSKGDLGAVGSIRRELHHSILRRYRMRYLSKAEAISDGAGEMLTADEQRQFNRFLLTSGTSRK